MKDFPIKDLESLIKQICEDIDFDLRETISNFITALYIERGRDKVGFEKNVNVKFIDLIDKICQKSDEINIKKNYEKTEIFLNKRIRFLNELIFLETSAVNNLTIFSLNDDLISKKIFLDSYLENNLLNSPKKLENIDHKSIQDDQKIVENFDKFSLSKKLRIQTNLLYSQVAN